MVLQVWIVEGAGFAGVTKPVPQGMLLCDKHHPSWASVQQWRKNGDQVLPLRSGSETRFFLC